MSGNVRNGGNQRSREEKEANCVVRLLLVIAAINTDANSKLALVKSKKHYGSSASLQETFPLSRKGFKSPDEPPYYQVAFFVEYEKGNEI